MQNKSITLTKKGLEELKKELDELSNVKRPKLVDRLAFARSQGDLSENSDYNNAREELEFLDGRIEELMGVIQNAKVSNGVNGDSSSINLGTKVTVVVNSIKHIFEIVGDWEADPINKKISPESPLGKALVGKKVGDTVEVEAPAGKIVYKILAIE
ncbi:transcription elongation factor GreA [Candidatus Woesebacteria bacterium]|nr:transcription elongation factor GreA [Candidatus Woesebacteria bacterium]